MTCSIFIQILDKYQHDTVMIKLQFPSLFQMAKQSNMVINFDDKQLISVGLSCSIYARHTIPDREILSKQLGETLNFIFNEVMEMLSVVQYYQTMNNKEKINQILADIQKIRLKTHIGSQKLQDFLYYQHLKVTGSNNSIFLCGLCGVSRKQVSQSFKRAFKTLSDLQKAEFYLLNIKNAQIILNGKNPKIQNEVLKIHEQPEKIKLILKAGQIVKKQSIVDVQLLRNEKIVRIANKKVQINLHNFLMRKSKGKDRNQIILQATHASPIGNTIRISNSGVQFEDILNIFTQIWKQAQFDNIYDIIHKSKSQKAFQLKTLKTKFQIKDCSSNYEKNQEIPSNSQGSYQGQKQVYHQEEDARETYMKTIQSFSSFNKFEQIRFGQSHEKKGLRVRKSILFSSPNWKCRPQQLQKLLTMEQTLYKMKPFIKSLQILGKNNKQYEIKQVHEIEGKLFNFEYNRTFITHHGTFYIIDKQQKMYSRKNTIKKLTPFVRHCIWRVRQIGNFVQLFVEAKVQYSTNLKSCEVDRIITSHFIGELSNITEIMNKNQQKQEESKKELECEDEQQIFYTLPGSLIDDDKHQQQVVQLPLQLQQFQQFQTSRNLDQNGQFGIKQIESNFLIFKHIQKPCEKGQDKRIVSQKGHWLWQDEWVVKQNGDLVNINQEKINIQSSVLKLVVKNMSRNILSGKGILNTSLPIQIFGVDSNLQRLARGYIFGPIFLEKAAQIPDPVQRMKLIVCFALGFSLAYIKMEKPFNPILGETYQGLIDGCPVYGEQISHHPPISSLYMLGRGYRVYGSLEAKVEMGLNTAAGINEGFNNIEFEKFKGKIRFTSPPGQLSGLIYGERKITVTRKSYYFDQENKLYCQIQWGKKKSVNDSLANSNDFFVGKIVKLKCEVSEKNYKNINKNDIIEEYGEMRGRLTKQVNFNNQTLFNVEKLAPHQIIEYSPCLASDSGERKDIAYKKQNNLKLAQQSKQQLQELQRRDKKLRHENKKKT